MQVSKLRRLPLILALAAVVSISGASITNASSGGSSGGFQPQLQAETTGSTTVASADASAPYTSKAKAKKKAKAKAKAKKKARAKAKRLKAAKAKAKKKSLSKQAKAKALLAAKVRQYPILKGATVSFGDARGYQAISYYQSGRIIISRKHKASLERIISHEVWHIIDWRDNHRIDWGESLPPRNASSFRR